MIKHKMKIVMKMEEETEMEDKWILVIEIKDEI